MTVTILGTGNTSGWFSGLRGTTYLKNLAQWLAPYRQILSNYYYQLLLLSSGRVIKTKISAVFTVHLFFKKWGGMDIETHNVVCPSQ